MTAPDSAEATTHRDSVQRRTVATLSMSQILGGVSLASGVAVGALLAEQVSGSPTYAGLGSTFQVIGSALIAVPLARLSAARGRRPGLVLGYALSFVGALGLIAAGIIGNFALLLVASLLFGGSTASNNQARYAAADLADPSHRGRDLSLVVWATTIGSVLRPNLVGPSEPVSDLLGIPRLTGPFVFSLIGLLLAIAVLIWRLRPDPLIEARHRLTASDPSASGQTHGSIGRGLRVIVARPKALLGLITLALGHVTMVSVMVMTPLHMRHGHADLTIIGFVISMHILGMFAFSPLTGMAVDRLGGRVVAMVGSGILVVATLLASTAPMGHSTRLLIALFLLGLGWSCTLVSGSTLLTGAVPTAERPGAQGASDLVMGLSAGLGGALAGVVVDRASFHALSLACLVIALAIGAAALVLRDSTDQHR
ncbi:MFS transporter [Knoellia sp. CPCC 206453]|uniref:MFS transporter n=1 Tax=Knoellia pratensis TaxID=3404796 RepID=UPI003606B241